MKITSIKVVPSFSLRRGLLFLLLLVTIGSLSAQDIEPRRWNHLPSNTNVIGIGYTHTRGEIFIDPTLQIEDANVVLNGGALFYMRSFSLLGKTARVDGLLPFATGTWEGTVAGVPAARSRTGLVDPRLRISWNFLGAPALKGKEYLEFRKSHPIHTSAGCALAIRAPLGQYFEDRLVNLGLNRWVIRPQLGVVHVRKAWSYELTGSVFFFTDNNAFWDGNKREQQPLYAIQGHVIHTFKFGLWASASGGYGYGGGSLVNGDFRNDTNSNFAWAISAGMPYKRRHLFKVSYANFMTFVNIGLASDNFAFAYSFLW